MALASKTDPLFDNFAHLKTFPDHILRDIARNDCAEHDYRKHAVEILVVRKSPLVKHPDLQPFVHELYVELDGIPFEYPDPGPGPLVAGVTTKTMFANEVVRDSLSDPEVEIGSEPEIPQESVPEPEVTQAKPKRQHKPKETLSDVTQ